MMDYLTNSTSAGLNMYAGEFELKMQEKSKHDPRLSSSDQSECTIRAQMDLRAHQRRKPTQESVKPLTRDQRTHLPASCTKLRSVGAQPGSTKPGGSAEPGRAPLIYLFHVLAPHWLPMAVQGATC
jgi:hypothetical protein